MPCFSAIDSVNKRIFSERERKWIETVWRLQDELPQSKKEAFASNHGLPYLGGNVCRSLRLAEIARISSVTLLCGIFLFKLVRALRPVLCLELGTCIGVSAAYQGAGLELNRRGKLLTVEKQRDLIVSAKKKFTRLKLNHRIATKLGNFNSTLADLAREKKAFDFVFIDGHHERDATISDFKSLQPILAKQAVIIFDDIKWSKGMREAWNIIKQDSRIAIDIDLGRMGICIIEGTRSGKKSFNAILK